MADIRYPTLPPPPSAYDMDPSTIAQAKARADALDRDQAANVSRNAPLVISGVSDAASSRPAAGDHLVSVITTTPTATGR
jgi:hypothetical protein